MNSSGGLFVDRGASTALAIDWNDPSKLLPLAMHGPGTAFVLLFQERIARHTAL